MSEQTQNLRASFGSIAFICALLACYISLGKIEFSYPISSASAGPSATVDAPAPAPFVITDREQPRSAVDPDHSEGNALQPKDGAGRGSFETTHKATQNPLRYDVTVYTAPWCAPCKAAQKRDGSGDANIRLTYVNAMPPELLGGEIRTFPTYCWQGKNGKTKCLQGPPRSLKSLLATIEANEPAGRSVE